MEYTFFCFTFKNYVLYTDILKKYWNINVTRMYLNNI